MPFCAAFVDSSFSCVEAVDYFWCEPVAFRSKVAKRRSAEQGNNLSCGQQQQQRHDR